MGAATHSPLAVGGSSDSASEVTFSHHIGLRELRTEKIIPMLGNDDSDGIYLLIRR